MEAEPLRHGAGAWVTVGLAAAPATIVAQLLGAEPTLARLFGLPLTEAVPVGLGIGRGLRPALPVTAPGTLGIAQLSLAGP